MTSGKLKSERRSIAQMLRIRFGAPIRTLIARLNRIDSSETLDQLSDYSVVRKDYDAFLEDLSSSDKRDKKSNAPFFLFLQNKITDGFTASS